MTAQAPFLSEEEDDALVFLERTRVGLQKASGPPTWLQETLLEAAAELKRNPVQNPNVALRYPLPVTIRPGKQAVVYFQVFASNPRALSTYEVYACTDEGTTVSGTIRGSRFTITSNGLGPLPFQDILADPVYFLWLNAEVPESERAQLPALGLTLLGLSFLIALAITQLLG